jgi:hypothetical protein
MIADRKRRVLTAIIGVCAVVLLGASDCTHGDSSAGDVDHAPADVLQFPNGFRNIAHKCDGPNMVYSVSAGASDSLPGGVFVVANDPRCH